LRRKASVPGTIRVTAPRPVCSQGHTRPVVKDGRGLWICPECVNEHIQKQSKIKLARGVETPDRFSRLFPNRRFRRRAR
jgi:ribosomal protein L37AE/L43A